MIHIEPVAWPLLVTNSRECPIQAVAKPVQNQKEIRQYQPGAGFAGIPIRAAYSKKRQETEQGQMIGVQPGRQPIREPNQDAFFERSQKAVLQSFGRVE